MLPFYEYQTKQFQITSGSDLSFPPHLHAATEILYVKSGQVLTQQGQCSVPVAGGELILFFPNEVHAYTTLQPGSRFLMLIYRGRLGEEIEQVFKTQIPGHSHLKATELPEELGGIFSSLEKAEKNCESPLIIRLYFSLAWLRLFPLLQLRPRPQQLPDDLLVSVLSYISENAFGPVSLQSLSTHFGVSRYKISRLFGNALHMGLNDYVNTLRIDRARSLLQSPDLSILDVAFACGFESQQTFNRVFKLLCGTTPKAFRRELHL